MAEAEPTSHSQRSLLAGVMLVILLACVGAAWWLSQRGNAPASILDEMRKTTLTKLWGDEPRTDFYLITDAAGQTVVWSAFAYRPTDNGVSGTTHVGNSVPENWELSNNATSGQYAGAMRTDQGVLRTRITYGDGFVTVEQQLGNRGIHAIARAKAPVNYVPEGSLALVVRLVNQRGQGGKFAMIFDEIALAPDNGRAEVRFTPVTLSPVQNGIVRMEYETKDGRSASIFHLNGDVLEEVEYYTVPQGKAEELTRVRKLIAPDEVEARFPDDEVLGRLVEEAKKEHRPVASQAASEPDR